ncbi:MAG: MotA/TolQ/ExbB proton channel family protein [Candidatus Magnetoovum sp. WYHC-5]|nr:MotA/TolQ/ExbB proton channel family protein [Candidatus Magnetoovum sp. WYHC-5]
MNIASILFMSVGILAVAFSVIRGIDVGTLLNTDALIIVIGGSIVATLIGHPIKRIKTTMMDLLDSFKKKDDREDLLQEILSLAVIHRKEGIRSLEKAVSTIKDNYLRFGVNLIIHNHKDSEIRNMMEREMAIKVVNSNFSLDILRSLSKLTPALGLAGTVISLIKMFKHFNTVEEVLPLMAVALMSTFYGVIISNVIVLPLYAKIKGKSIMSEALMNITIEGVISISNKENPIVIEDKLAGYDSKEKAAPVVVTAPEYTKGSFSPPQRRQLTVGGTTSKYI